MTGIFDLGLGEGDQVPHGAAFYSVEVNVLVNQDAWKGLNDAQRKVLSDAALWLEGLDSENDAAIKAERDRQAAAGIQALDLGPAAAKGFLDRANDVAWQSVSSARRRMARSCASWREIGRLIPGRREAASWVSPLPAGDYGFRAPLRGTEAAEGGPRHSMIPPHPTPYPGGPGMTAEFAERRSDDPPLGIAFGRLFDRAAIAAALILLAMVVIVTADIVLRNLGRGFVWANKVSEYSPI